MPESSKEWEKIVKFRDAVLKENSEWCLLAAQWWMTWEKFAKASQDDTTNTRPGIINNSSLLDDTDTLKRNVREFYDYVLIPEEAYKTLVSWYGGGPAITRKVIARADPINSSTTVELYPVVCQVYSSTYEGDPDEAAKVTLRISVSSDISTVLLKVADLFECPPDRSRLSVKKSSQIVEDVWCVLPSTGMRMSHILHMSASTETVSLLLETMDETSEMFPRDLQRNAWRYDVKVGDFVDALDQEKKWCEGMVTSLSTPPGEHNSETVTGIHFRGWAPRFDMTLKLLSGKDIQKPFTKVRNWRDLLRVGDIVEMMRDPGAEERVWYQGQVMKLAVGCGMVLVQEASSRNHGERNWWLPIQSELLCGVGTHIKQRTRQEQVDAPPGRDNGGGRVSPLPNCSICMNAERNSVLIPCGHICVCEGCCDNLVARNHACPVCRSHISSSFRVFL